MSPPQDPDPGMTAEASDTSAAVSLCPAPAIISLRNRPDFLRAASARRQAAGGFLLQARAREDGSPAVRVGYTASKKIGGAVDRNRAKRRLRALVRAVLPGLARPGWDYVLVAKPGATVTRDFALLKTDLEGAMRGVHRDPAAGPAPR